MIMISKKCPSCGEELKIEENTLFFSEEEVKEEVFCPFCKAHVYEAKTDGWFTVTSEKIEKLKPSKSCVYPMP